MDISQEICDKKDELPYVTIAILCKDKAHVLSFFLHTIYNLEYAKERIYLYIRTNDNKDNSAEILEEWINRVKCEYKDVYYNNTSINEELKMYQPHEWNGMRFKVLGNIRNESIKYAIKNNTDYFVVDCDNFIKPKTLKTMVSANKPVVAPFLKDFTDPIYSNFFYKSDKNGFYEDCVEHYDVYYQRKIGVFPVDVVHCTYYIKNQYLIKCDYIDDTDRYEFIVLSENLRRNNVQQYFDNREIYGYMTVKDTKEEYMSQLTCEKIFHILGI